MVLFFSRTGLLAIDPVSGTVRWQHRHRASLRDSVNGIVPIVEDDLVFISECYQVGSVVLKMSAHSVEVVWKDPPSDRRRQAMRSHWATPVLVNGSLYGCSGRNPPDSDFRCIELKTGALKWSDPRRVRSSVTRVGDHLLVMEERGTLQVIRIDSTRLDIVAEWDLTEPSGDRPRLMYPCWSAPIVVGNKLVTRGSRNIVCLELAKK